MKRRMRIDPKRPSKGRTDWARVDAMTDEEIVAAARSDPDCHLPTKRELARFRRVPVVKHVRLLLGLSQRAFAERFGFALTTVRDWEQGRAQPDRAKLLCLRLIARHPKEAEEIARELEPAR